MASTSSQDHMTRLLQCGTLLTRHCFTVSNKHTLMRYCQWRVTGDDKYIISGSVDKTIGVWDIANKMLLHCFQEAHSDMIFSVGGDRR